MMMATGFGLGAKGLSSCERNVRAEAAHRINEGRRAAQGARVRARELGDNVGRRHILEQRQADRAAPACASSAAAFAAGRAPALFRASIAASRSRCSSRRRSIWRRISARSVSLNSCCAIRLAQLDSLSQISAQASNQPPIMMAAAQVRKRDRPAKLCANCAGRLANSSNSMQVYKRIDRHQRVSRLEMGAVCVTISSSITMREFLNVPRVAPCRTGASSSGHGTRDRRREDASGAPTI